MDSPERKQINEQFPIWRTQAGISSRDALLDQNIDWTLQSWRVENPDATSTPQDFQN